MPRKVECRCERPGLKWKPSEVRRLFRTLDAGMHEQCPAGSLSILFVGPETCSQLHAAFFDDPAVTDVMTFPGDPDENHAGDIAVCVDYALESAPQHNWSFSEELSLYLLHGWLHLAGHDDRSAAPRRKMRAAEKRALALLREQTALPIFELKNGPTRSKGRVRSRERYENPVPPP